jgi:hypothetical protein
MAGNDSRPLKAEIKGRTLDAENLIESFASLLPKRVSDCSKPSGSAHTEPFIALTPPDVLPVIWGKRHYWGGGCGATCTQSLGQSLT